MAKFVSEGHQAELASASFRVFEVARTWSPNVSSPVVDKYQILGIFLLALIYQCKGWQPAEAEKQEREVQKEEESTYYAKN